MGKLSSIDAAKLLNVPIDKLKILENQGLIHPVRKEDGESLYSSNEISQIKSRRVQTISDDAAVLESEIQRKTVSVVGSFQKVLGVTGALLALYLVSVAVMTVIFIKYPLQASDFFGYYYRYNTTNKPQAINIQDENSNVLAAATGPADVSYDPSVVSYNTSIVADILKPVAATSLVAVKAVNDQTYTNVVTPPVSATGITETATPTVVTGPAGAIGAQGPAGPAGATGSTGATGTIGALTLESGLSGNITNGNLTLGLGSITEADTLASVTGRGSITSSNIATTGTGAITSAGLLSALGDLTVTKSINIFQQSNGTPGLSSNIRSDYNNLYLTNSNGKVTIEKATDESHALYIQEANFPYQGAGWWFDGSSATSRGVFMASAPDAGDINMKINGPVGNYGLKVLDSAGNTKITALSNGDLTVSGNIIADNRIGIGTDSPTSQLSIHSQNDYALADIKSDNANSASGLILKNDDNASSTFALTGTTYGTNLPDSFLGITVDNVTALKVEDGDNISSNGLLIGTTGNAPIVLGTNNTLNMIIKPTGDIGIGTDSPDQALTFASGSTVDSLGSLTISATTLNLNGGTSGVFVNGATTQTNGKLVLCIDNTTHQLYLGASSTSCDTSSEKFKNNIANITLGLDTVNTLRPVSYNYNSDSQPALGFIAEEVAQVEPRLVVLNAQGLPYALNSDEFIPILTKAIQQLSGYLGSVSEGTLDNLFAKKIRTNELCLKKSDGTEVCVNGDQLNNLLPSATPTPIPTITPSASPTPQPSPTASAGEATPTDSPIASPSATPAI